MDWGTILDNSISQMIRPLTAVFALAAIGLNVHFGYTGLLNFGQVAFMAVGAYGVAISVLEFGVPLWVGVLIGIGAAVVLAALLGHTHTPPSGRLPRHRHHRHRRDPALDDHGTVIPRLHGWVRWAVGLQRRLHRSQPVLLGQLWGRLPQVQRRRHMEHRRRMVAGAPGRAPGLAVDAQPLGPGREGDPGGRGCGQGAGQERVRVQDAEPDRRRRDRRLRGHVPGHTAGFDHSRQLHAGADVLRVRGAHSRRGGTHLGTGGRER